MDRALNNKERTLLKKRVAEVEKRTGAQIVLSVIERSDSYAEIPWKAFALGVSVAGFLVFIFHLLFAGWCSTTTFLLSVIIILIAGIITALFSIYLPDFARVFLPAHRADTEVRQYAESIFLSNELFATRKRTGILLLVSLFERQVILLPDKGFNRKLKQKVMQKIIEQMTSYLASGRVALALAHGLAGLEKVLAVKKIKKSGKNELADDIIEKKGAWKKFFP